MKRFVEPIQIWGTVVTLELYGEKSELARESIYTFFQQVDQHFSTYREDSDVTALRKGADINGFAPDVQHAWSSCLELRDRTHGAFDPWAARGGFDPSGFVKGWAADRARDIARTHEVEHGQIDAAGDITVFGGKPDGSAWRIGIRHPEIPDQVATTTELFDGAVAGSGNYERGAHTVDPFTQLPAIGARATAVVGPDGGVADALATAVMVHGEKAAAWLPDFPEYSAWAVDFSSDTTWSLGEAFS